MTPFQRGVARQAGGQIGMPRTTTGGDGEAQSKVDELYRLKPRFEDRRL